MFFRMYLTYVYALLSVTAALVAEDKGAWSQRVYLATYPRSGNHWLRYLIEEATHIVTSSVYCDPDPQHLKAPFPWGGYCVSHGYEGMSRYPEENEPFVIKTHFPCLRAAPFDQQPKVKVVRIVRHPIDSIYSYYVYMNKNKVVSSRIPMHDLYGFIASWRRFQLFWDDQPHVLTVRYEDMMQKPGHCLAKVLTFIGYAFTTEDIERAVAKHPPQGELFKHLVHYKREDLDLMKYRLYNLMHIYGYRFPPKT